jgi:hypothetical protein
LQDFIGKNPELKGAMEMLTSKYLPLGQMARIPEVAGSWVVIYLKSASDLTSRWTRYCADEFERMTGRKLEFRLAAVSSLSEAASAGSAGQVAGSGGSGSAGGGPSASQKASAKAAAAQAQEAVALSRVAEEAARQQAQAQQQLARPQEHQATKSGLRAIDDRSNLEKDRKQQQLPQVRSGSAGSAGSKGEKKSAQAHQDAPVQKPDEPVEAPDTVDDAPHREGSCSRCGLHLGALSPEQCPVCNSQHPEAIFQVITQYRRSSQNWMCTADTVVASEKSRAHMQELQPLAQLKFVPKIPSFAQVLKTTKEG